MNQELKRKIGLFGLTSSGVGMILGAGIYALIGTAAGVAGNSVWISFLLGALISSFTGLSYAELSSMIPRAAAEYSYAREAFENDLTLFLIGWIIIFTETVAAFTVALGFGGYFESLFGAPVGLTSLILVILLSLLNLAGVEESSRVNIVFTIIEALATRRAMHPFSVSRTRHIRSEGSVRKPYNDIRHIDNLLRSLI